MFLVDLCLTSIPKTLKSKLLLIYSCCELTLGPVCPKFKQIYVKELRKPLAQPDWCWVTRRGVSGAADLEQQGIAYRGPLLATGRSLVCPAPGGLGYL